jgi:uncharacterized membrane protein
MDILMVILRLVHIFAGIFWVGTGLFVAIIIIPAMQNMRSSQLMQMIMRHSRFDMAMTVSALLTTLAGVWLYVRVSDGFNADWMRDPGSIVLSIGAVAGLLAFGHGGAALGSITGKYAKLAKALDGEPSAAQQQELMALQARIATHSRISLILMIIAVIGMASARYL